MENYFLTLIFFPAKIPLILIPAAWRKKNAAEIIISSIKAKIESVVKKQCMDTPFTHLSYLIVINLFILSTSINRFRLLPKKYPPFCKAGPFIS